MSDSQFAERLSNIFPFIKGFAMVNQVVWESLVFKKQVVEGKSRERKYNFTSFWTFRHGRSRRKVCPQEAGNEKYAKQSKI